MGDACVCVCKGRHIVTERHTALSNCVRGTPMSVRERPRVQGDAQSVDLGLTRLAEPI